MTSEYDADLYLHPYLYLRPYLAHSYQTGLRSKAYTALAEAESVVTADAIERRFGA